MRRIWAVARQTIAEGLRMKIALVFIAVIVIMLPVLPFTVAGDGATLRSRVQSFLAYSLGSVSFLLSLLTVFLSCAAIANEIRGKQIVMVACKPLPRWQFFAGKWLGISLLNAALLIGTGLTVWGFTRYLASRPTDVPEDREILNAEVLVARHTVRPERPDFAAMVDNRVRKLREEGRIDKLTQGSEEEIRTQIHREFKGAWASLGPQQWKQFTFKGLRVDRESNTWVHLRIKPYQPGGVDDIPYKLLYQAGDTSDISTMTNESIADLIAKRTSTIPIPVGAVNKEGTLTVRLANLNPRDTMAFQEDDDFVLLCDQASFGWNVAMALVMIWTRLAFLAALGLMASAAVSFPVACLVSFVILFAASACNFLVDALDAVNVRSTGRDPMWIIGPIIRTFGAVFLYLVPNFSEYDPVSNVVNGQLVTLNWVLQSLLFLVCIKTLIIGLLGCVLLTRRELAQVVV